MAGAFERLGLCRIDADRLAHQALDLPRVRAAVRRRFGSQVVAADGAVDRNALGRIAFAEPRALRFLESLLHPLVRREIRRRLAEVRATGSHPGVVLDVPLLFESGLDRLCTALVFIRSRRADRERRTMRTRGWPKDAVRTRERRQWTLTEKRRRAGYHLDNRDSVRALPDRVARLLARILRAGPTRPPAVPLVAAPVRAVRQNRPALSHHR